MTKRTSRREILRNCEAIGPEDGIDPRELIRRATNSTDERKTRQLCRQVERTLSFVLGGEVSDERLRDLMILSVDPAPHSNHLLVTMQTNAVVTGEQLIALEGILSSHKGTMRTAIANAINRRKTPDISLRVVNPPMP